MRIPVLAALHARDGWIPYCEQMSESHGFVMKWIKEVMVSGSERVGHLVDNLDDMLNCPIVSFQHTKLADVLEDASIRFTHYDAEQGIALFGVYLDTWQT